MFISLSMRCIFDTVTVCIPMVIIPKLLCWLRLEKRALEIDTALAAVESKITKTNTIGIIDGFKSEFPGLKCDSFT